MATKKYNLEAFLAGKIDQFEVLNYVEKKLLKQGCASTDGISCTYRGKNGTQCAIGHLILDNDYDHYMEHKGISQIIGTDKPYKEYTKNLTEKEEDILENKIDFLDRMQAAHDGLASYEPDAFIDNIKYEFDDIRREYRGRKI